MAWKPWNSASLEKSDLKTTDMVFVAEYSTVFFGLYWFLASMSSSLSPPQKRTGSLPSEKIFLKDRNLHIGLSYLMNSMHINFKKR